MKIVHRIDEYVVVQITNLDEDMQKIEIEGSDEDDFANGRYIFGTIDEHEDIYPINMTLEEDGEPTLDQVREWIENWGWK